MPRGKLTTTGSVLGKNRNAHKKTNHEQKKDSNAKKRITAEEYRKHKREIDQLLRGLKGKSNLREAELD
ncbi:MAG TPA: hypothetical protein PLK55_03210 [archaeon]|jgi:hypothetical protein|nr:hypothetical protein [archaeon]